MSMAWTQATENSHLGGEGKRGNKANYQSSVFCFLPRDYDVKRIKPGINNNMSFLWLLFYHVTDSAFLKPFTCPHKLWRDKIITPLVPASSIV